MLMVDSWLAWEAIGVAAVFSERARLLTDGPPPRGLPSMAPVSRAERGRPFC